MPNKTLLLGYLLLAVGPILGLALILGYGQRLSAPMPVSASSPAEIEEAAAPSGGPDVVILIAQMIVILSSARLAGLVARRFGQPSVIGEMAAGMLLGPSLLGRLLPVAHAALFPPQSLGYLTALSEIGMIMYMFCTGLDLDLASLRSHGKAAALVSHASIAVPMLSGAGLALYLYPRVSDSSVGFAVFALFTGAAMAVTAFPVLVRILHARGLSRTRVGTMAIACAAVDDVTGWCILASIVMVARSGEASRPPWAIAAGLVAFLAVMILAVRPWLGRLGDSYAGRGLLSDNQVGLVVLVVLASSLGTGALGLHLLFGAFVAGTITPRGHGLGDYLAAKFAPFTSIILLPLFFALTGLRMRFEGFQDPGMWLNCALVTGVAVAGKVGGAGIAARVGGMSWRDAGAIGVLVNTRGLMELVILSIGLEIKVISPSMFSMMVVMALVTTFMTTPMLRRIYPEPLNGESPDPSRAGTLALASPPRPRP